LNALVYNPKEGLYDSPYRLEELRLLPGVAEAVGRINRLGYLAIVISNQPGVAKGKCDVQKLMQLTDRLKWELARQGAHLDGVYYCLHHPEARVAALRMACDCRKPRPGLFLQAVRDFNIDCRQSFMVGDRAKDIEAGREAGCRTVLIHSEATGMSPSPATAPPDFEVANLLEAVHLLGQGGGKPWRSSWIPQTLPR